MVTASAGARGSTDPCKAAAKSQRAAPLAGRRCGSAGARGHGPCGYSVLPLRLREKKEKEVLQLQVKLTREALLRTQLCSTSACENTRAYSPEPTASANAERRTHARKTKTGKYGGGSLKELQPWHHLFPDSKY